MYIVRSKEGPRRVWWDEDLITFEDNLKSICLISLTEQGNRNEALDQFLEDRKTELERRKTVAILWNAWVEEGATHRAADRQEKKNKRKSE